MALAPPVAESDTTARFRLVRARGVLVSAFSGGRLNNNAARSAFDLSSPRRAHTRPAFHPSFALLSMSRASSMVATRNPWMILRSVFIALGAALVVGLCILLLLRRRLLGLALVMKDRVRGLLIGVRSVFDQQCL